jgi:hypothetical protein
MLTIHSSRWHGWKLILLMSLAYYLVLTVVTQLEAWYFLYGITIGPQLMQRLFLQGIPVAFIFVPIAVLLWDARVRSYRYAQGMVVKLVSFIWSISQSVPSSGLHRLAKPDVRLRFAGERSFFQQMAHIFTKIVTRLTFFDLGGAFLVNLYNSLWQTALLVRLVSFRRAGSSSRTNDR